MSAAQETAVLAQVGHFYFGAVGQSYVAANTPHPERQSPRPMTGGNQLSKRQHFPSVAALAIGRELVAVFIQSVDASQIDHGSTLRGGGAHGVSLRLSLP